LKGFEKFKVRLRVSKADKEDCEAQAGTSCGNKTPYATLGLTKVYEIDGKLIDNEGLELKYGDAKRLTSEDGGETTFTLDPVPKTVTTSYANKKLTCSSDNEAEAKVTAYKIGAGDKTTIGNAEAVTLTKEEVTFFVTGQADNIVDGPQKFGVSCELDDTTTGGAILPLSFTNEDVNVPAIVVNTEESKKFVKAGQDGCSEDESSRDNKMVGGCGVLRFGEKDGSDTFTVKLATKPVKDVVIIVRPSDGKRINVEPNTATFTPTNWDTAVLFTVSGKGEDGLLQDDGYAIESVDISVDNQLTKDIGETKFQRGKPIQIYGYVNCVGARDRANVDVVKETTTAAPGQDTTTTASTVATSTTTTVATTTTVSTASTTTTGRELTKDDIEDLKLKRIDTPIKCFSFDVDKVSGTQAKMPDNGLLTLRVRIDDETANLTVPLLIGGGVIAGIIIVIIIVVIACAIAAALLAMAIKKKRAEELDRKADIKKDADKAEGEIEFRMDDLDEEMGMDDLEGTTSKLKGERDRLKDENEKLAAEVGEEPMDCATTEDPDLLVEQIKSLKGENDRLREMSSSRSNKRKKKKKKAEGFGQQQD